MVRSSEDLLALPPADVERLIAGAQRRREREEDHIVRLLLAIVGPYVKDHLTPYDLMKRELGESRVPGYERG